MKITNMDLIPTVKEGIELGLHKANSITMHLTLDALCCIAIGEEVNLFSHVNTEDGKRFFVTERAKKIFRWEIENRTGQAKIDRNGKITGLKEGTISVKLLRRIGPQWFKLCSKQLEIVDIVLPQIHFQCDLENSNGKSTKGLEKPFNVIECSFKNNSQKEIKVWHNLNVKEIDWRILWASPIGETTTVSADDEKVISFSTDSDLLDLKRIRTISYTFDCDGKTFAVYYDVFREITTFCVVRSKF